MLSISEENKLQCLKAKQISKTEWLSQEQFERIKELQNKKYKSNLDYKNDKKQL